MCQVPYKGQKYIMHIDDTKGTLMYCKEHVQHIKIQLSWIKFDLNCYAKYNKY